MSQGSAKSNILSIIGFDEEQLQLLNNLPEQTKFNLLCQEYNYLQSNFSLIIQENAILKEQLCHHSDKLKDLEQKPSGSKLGIPQFDSKIVSFSEKDQKALYQQLKALKKEKQNWNKEKGQIEKKFQEKEQQKIKWNEQSGKLQKQLQSLRENQSNYKKDIEQQKKVIQDMKIKHQNDKQAYEKSFLERFQQAYDNLIQKEQEIKNQQKQQLLKKLNNSQSNLKMVISKLNQILVINYKGEDDVQGWLKQFEKQMKYFQFESKHLVVDKISSQTSFALNAVQLQKQKNAASRYHIMQIKKQRQRS